MEVTIKDLSVEMNIKNRGIELDVYDNDGTHLGDLIINKKWLIWCKGKTTQANGVKISWRNFIEFMQDEEA